MTHQHRQDWLEAVLYSIASSKQDGIVALLDRKQRDMTRKQGGLHVDLLLHGLMYYCM